MRAEGMALLAVVAATAALAVLVATVSLAAAAGAASAGYRSQRAQAEWLIEGAVGQTVRAFETGRLSPPVEASRVICDGTDMATGANLPIAVFPSAIPGWGRWTESASEHRVCVELAVVRGPGGEPRGVTAADDGTLLVDATVQAWHGHANARRQARLLVHAAGAYRLH